MAIKKCALADCGRLAVLNKQLIEDEGHDNPMDVAQLAERMAAFSPASTTPTTSGARALRATRCWANALVRAPWAQYLRHFFICREQRRRGYGRRFFRELLANWARRASTSRC
jgi:hypothetical protein